MHLLIKIYETLTNNTIPKYLLITVNDFVEIGQNKKGSLVRLNNDDNLDILYEDVFVAKDISLAAIETLSTIEYHINNRDGLFEIDIIENANTMVASITEYDLDMLYNETNS